MWIAGVDAMKVLVFGSTGRTGRHLVAQALEQGHAVTAFVRDSSKLEMRHEKLRLVRGDVLDPASVESAVQGQEVVLSGLGARPGQPKTVFSDGMRTILRFMETQDVPRIVCVSAAGVLHEDAGSFLANALLGLFRLTLRGVYEGHRWQLEAIRESSLEWVAVRPVLLTNGPRTGKYRVELEGNPEKGYRISRADVADFMLKQLTRDEYVRRLPAIAY